MNSASVAQINKFWIYIDFFLIDAAGQKCGLRKIKASILLGFKREVTKNIYVRERLPAMDAYIKKLAEGKGLITSTNNCTVSVLCDQGDGRKKLVKVNDVTELENLKNPIVREQNRRPDQITGFRKPKRPLRLTDDERADRLFASFSPEQKKAIFEIGKAN